MRRRRGVCNTRNGTAVNDASTPTLGSGEGPTARPGRSQTHQESQGALAAVLTAVRESSAKQAEGLTRLEERLKNLEAKQETSCERLAKKIRKEKPYSFKRKGHEGQHDFNEKVKETLETVAEALSEETVRDLDKVTATKKAIDEGIEMLERRQKLIKLADRSEYGWRTVDEYEEDDLAKDSDDEKRMAKAEYRAEKKQKRAAAKTATSTRKNFRPYDRYRGNGAGHIANTSARSGIAGYATNFAYGTGLSGVQQGQPYRQFNQSPAGPCFACGKMGHVRRDCPGPGGGATSLPPSGKRV